MSFNTSLGESSNATKNFRQITSIQFSSSVESENVEFEASEDSDPWKSFADIECGEPMHAQRLVLDFTPDKYDIGQTEQKCCEFWEFFSNNPELYQMMEVPNESCFKESASTKNHRRAPESMRSETETSIKDVNKTAVSMLEVCERDALLTSAMETKMYHSMCTLGSREYPNDDDIPVTMASAKPLPALRVIGPKKSEPSKSRVTQSKPEIVALCKKLGDWDKENPKSFEPPLRLKYDLL